MSTRATVATTARVLTQVRRDHRTVALLLGVPLMLITLLRYVFDGQPQVFDRVGPDLLGLFPFTTMFVVTSIATLRERTTGTLERLLTLPLAKTDLIGGYAAAFALVAIVQVGLAAAVALGPLGLHVAGGVGLLFLLAVLNALLGMALGLALSAFAKTEFQAVQFLPAAVLPQLLLCGLFAPREQMAPILRHASDFMPLSYAIDGMTRIAAHPGWSGRLGIDVAVVAGCVLAAIALGAATLPRRSD